MKIENNQGENIISLTESELDAIYLYLALNIDSMNNKQKSFWHEILAKLDKDFELEDYED